MTQEQEAEMKIELKYCERCGGLWLRRAGEPEAYCRTCAPAMRDMAFSRKKRPGRPRKSVFHGDFGGAACA